MTDADRFESRQLPSPGEGDDPHALYDTREMAPAPRVSGPWVDALVMPTMYVSDNIHG